MPSTTSKPTAAPYFTFDAEGKTYELPDPTPHAEEIPGGVTRAVILRPEDTTAQMRLAFAMLDVCGADPAALAALDALPTGRMIEVVGEWLGESSDSSD